MNLSHLSDEILLQETKNLVTQERELLTCVLHHLREVERRRLFSALGFSSLYTYATGALGYSEDQAYRRIAAMRLLKTLPFLEEKIQDGKINLTNLSMAQSLFRKEEKVRAFSQIQKTELLEKLENKSKREAQEIIMQHCSEPMKFVDEKMRPVTEDLIEVRFTITKETEEKIKKLKGLLAHSDSNISLGKLLDKLCDLGIKKLDPAQKQTRPRRDRFSANSAPAKVTKAPGGPDSGSVNASDAAPCPAPVKAQAAGAAPIKQRGLVKQKAQIKQRGPAKSRHPTIPKSIQRDVWTRAKSQCEKCGSKYALQIDHLFPKALGGSHELENLRLLCRSCNQRAAIEIFGVKKMQTWMDAAT